MILKFILILLADRHVVEFERDIMTEHMVMSKHHVLMRLAVQATVACQNPIYHINYKWAHWNRAEWNALRQSPFETFRKSDSKIDWGKYETSFNDYKIPLLKPYIESIKAN